MIIILTLLSKIKFAPKNITISLKYAEFLAKQPGSGKSSYISNATQSKNSKFTIITNRKNIFKKIK